MNVFTLFESKDIESIKLGIQLVKTLGKEKEFENYFKKPLDKYEEVFNGLVLSIFNISDCSTILDDLLGNNLDISKLDAYEVHCCSRKYPKAFEYFFSKHRVEFGKKVS